METKIINVIILCQAFRFSFAVWFSFAVGEYPEGFRQFDCPLDITDLNETVKQMIPRDIVKLDCSNRPIKDIPPDFFSEFHFLTDLILADTLISMIQSDAFTGCYNLKFLVLTNSPITIIKEGSFNYLKSLKELHLGGIAMHSIPSALIDCLTELVVLVRPDGVTERLNHGMRGDVTTAIGQHVFFSFCNLSKFRNVTKESGGRFFCIVLRPCLQFAITFIYGQCVQILLIEAY